MLLSTLEELVESTPSIVDLFILNIVQSADDFIGVRFGLENFEAEYSYMLDAS
jgi:hypothetical protein